MFLSLLLWQFASAQITAGNFNVYGTVWNGFSFHSRNGIYDSGGLHYLLPSNYDWNEVNLDLNDEFCSEYASQFSTIGLEWSMPGTTSLNASLEADFYGLGAGEYGIRFKKANASVTSLMGRWFSIRALAGIDWHPMSVDSPVMVSQSRGLPFNPYNFSPQVTLEFGLWEHASVMASALWQMEFMSTGPNGNSREYQEHSQIPELYAGLHLYGNNWNFKAGADFLQIKPRQKGYFPFTEVYVWVNDQVQNLSFFAYADASIGCFKLQAKGVLAQSGEHLGLFGGYAWSRYFDDGTYGYCKYRTLSAWTSLSARLGKHVEPSLFVGYSKNLGTDDDLWSLTTGAVFYQANAYYFRQTAAAVPGLQLHFGPLNLGLEYSLQVVDYGDKSKMDFSTGLAGGEIERVMSHSITTSVGFEF